MQSVTRRSFFKSAAAGAAVLAIGGALQRPALAADDAKDVKFAKDPKNPQPGLETAHTPALTLEKVEAKGVAYGKTPAGEFYRVTVQAKHEATKDHHIDGIALFINGELVAEHSMNPAQAEASLPTIGFTQRLKAGDEVLAVTHCNIHGKWGNRTTV